VSITAMDGLHARTKLEYVVDHWTDLRARLRPGGGASLSGMPGPAGSRVPIDLAISDLLAKITDDTRSYAYELGDDDPEWTPRTDRMPWLLAEIAGRYGHWTAGDEHQALDFCDWAEDTYDKVRKTLEQPAPPDYLGPCQATGEDGAGCGGELYLRPGRGQGRCRECGGEFTRDGQMEYVREQLEQRLMTPSEIVRALKIVGHEIKAATVYKWVQRKRLVPAIPGDDLFRLADAIELAGKGKAA
jgi:hypothetical protein